MNQFVENNERKGRQAFKKLSEDQDWFQDIKFSENLTDQIDAEATTKKGKKVYIEIKTRGGKYGDFFQFIKEFDTIFLDYGKLNAVSNELMHDKSHGIDSGAIFVSVFNDGEIILIHNLKKQFKTKHLGLKEVTNFAKKEDGKDEKEWELKTGLDWQSASFYRRDSKGNYYKWEWDSDDYWDIMPLVKFDEDDLLSALNQIIYCSRLDDSNHEKRLFAQFIQGNVDTINEYLNMDLHREEF